MAPIPQPLEPSDLDPQSASRRSDGPDLLTQKQVCQRLGISPDTWTRWRKAGHVPEAVTLPSGRRKWRVADIDAFFLRGRAIESAPRRRYFRSVQASITGQLVAVK